MTDAEIEQWIGACNYGKARDTLRHYLQLRSAIARQPVAGDGVNGRAWKVGDRVIWTSRFGKPFAGTVTCVRDPIPVRYEVELDDGALCDPLGHELTAAPAATPTDGGEGS